MNDPKSFVILLHLTIEQDRPSIPIQDNDFALTYLEYTGTPW